MTTINPEKERQEFARRLNQALDDVGTVNKGRGRQADVAKLFGVTPGAARKWLEGESYPETDKLVQMAKVLKVRFEWLVLGEGTIRAAGKGAYRPAQGDIDSALLEEVIRAGEEALQAGGMASLSYAKRSRLFGYMYEEAKKDGKVDRDMVQKLLTLLI